MSVHSKRVLGKKDKKRWHYDKILVHLKEFEPDDNYNNKQKGNKDGKQW
jgi:hypothetical protein